MRESQSTIGNSFLAAYDLDQLSEVPQALRLRTLHSLALFVAAASIAAVIEWPRAWQLVVLGDLAVTSLLFAFAAGREWFLRHRVDPRFSPSGFVGTAQQRFEYRAAVP
jgi:hypothetical protein